VHVLQYKTTLIIEHMSLLVERDDYVSNDHEFYKANVQDFFSFIFWLLNDR